MSDFWNVGHFETANITSNIALRSPIIDTSNKQWRSLNECML